MKVLIQSYNTCCQNKSGGVQIRIRNFYKALRDANYEVDFFNWFSSDLREYDILHVFKLDIENLALIRSAKAMGKKVVLSPILNTINGKRVSFYYHFRKSPFSTTYKFLFQIIELVDIIIVETEEERNFLIKYYRAKAWKINVIGNGATDYSKGDESIYKRIGSVTKYVLHVGRFDENKNQLRVIQAVKGTDTHVVFIGGPDINSDTYYEKCCYEAKGYDNVHLLGWIKNSDPLLASAYAHAKVIICSSFSETFGLTIVEGAIAGAQPILSNKLAILEDEHFKKCITFEPSSVRSIANAINKAMNTANSKVFSESIKKDFSWENIANLHIRIYESLV